MLLSLDVAACELARSARGPGEDSVDACAAARHVDPSFGNPLQSLRVCFAFGLKDAGRQSMWRVVVVDRHHVLQDDRSVVVLIVDEMHRTAAHFAPYSSTL